MEPNYKKIRERKIVELRREGKTMSEIGEYFGVTRQRIEQISKSLPLEEHALFRYMKKPPVPRECSVCHIMFVRKDKKRKTCSAACAGVNRRKYPSPHAGTFDRNERKRWLYNNVPEYRLRIRANQNAYADRVNSDPVRREHKLSVMREYGRHYNRNKKA